MTTEIELLPLPEGEASSFGNYKVHDDEAMIEYARANVARNNALLRAEIERLAEALAGLITWIPSADTYRRLGFNPEAPMRALKEAKAVLRRDNSND